MPNIRRPISIPCLFSNGSPIKSSQHKQGSEPVYICSVVFMHIDYFFPMAEQMCVVSSGGVDFLAQIDMDALVDILFSAFNEDNGGDSVSVDLLDFSVSSTLGNM